MKRYFLGKTSATVNNNDVILLKLTPVAAI
jgi:hypothetical protein